MQPGRRKFYRDKFNGKLLGVCSGLGDYFETDPLWFRLAFIILFFFINFFVFIIYFAIVMLTEKKPPEMYRSSLTDTFSGPRVVEPARDLISPASRKGTDQ